jgi:hypothetical protein
MERLAGMQMERCNPRVFVAIRLRGERIGRVMLESGGREWTAMCWRSSVWPRGMFNGGPEVSETMAVVAARAGVQTVP